MILSAPRDVLNCLSPDRHAPAPFLHPQVNEWSPLPGEMRGLRAQLPPLPARHRQPLHIAPLRSMETGRGPTIAPTPTSAAGLRQRQWVPPPGWRTKDPTPASAAAGWRQQHLGQIFSWSRSSHAAPLRWKTRQQLQGSYTRRTSISNSRFCLRLVHMWVSLAM